MARTKTTPPAPPTVAAPVRPRIKRGRSFVTTDPLTPDGGRAIEKRRYAILCTSVGDARKRGGLEPLLHRAWQVAQDSGCVTHALRTVQAERDTLLAFAREQAHHTDRDIPDAVRAVLAAHVKEGSE